MEASLMDSTTLDGLDARPESTLLDTITKAEDAQENKNGEESIELWTKAAALARICYGKRHYYYALSHIKAAENYLYCLGLFEQSLYHANEGLDAIDSLLPVDKNSTKVLHAHAGCLCILGEIQIHKGHVNEAEKSVIQAERFSGLYSRSLDGKVDVILDARIALNFGRLCFKQKKLQMAKKCFQKALELFQSFKRRDSVLELKLLHDLTDVSIQLTDYQTANDYLDKAELLSTESFGPSSEERGETIMKKASLYMTMLKQDLEYNEENVAKAEGYLWDAYGILSVVKGSSDPRTLTAQDDIVKLFVLTEKYDEAVKVLKDLLPNKSRAYGEGSLEVARARKVLGSLYLYQGKTDKASEELKQVREVFVAVHGPNHKDSLEVGQTLDTLTGSTDGTKGNMKKFPFKTVI